MKNKCLQLLIVLISSTFAAYGQDKNSVFPDGTTIIFENKIVSKNAGLKVKAINILSASNGINIVHRAFIDRENKSHFGYDLEIKKEAEKGKYLVAFKPLSMVLFVSDSEKKVLPKFPEPLQLGEGEMISVELLENPKTKEKIADLIKIIQGEPNQKRSQQNRIIIPDIPNAKINSTTQTTRLMYETDSSVPPKDFTIDEVKMQITNANLVVNGKQFAEKKSALAGNIYFYLKGKGRFILSPFPREGFKFQKVGVIDLTKISFELNGDKYEIKSAMPIMFYGGKWNLWVLHEPDYRPNLETEEEFGGGKIESLIQKKSENQN